MSAKAWRNAVVLVATVVAIGVLLAFPSSRDSRTPAPPIPSRA